MIRILQKYGILGIIVLLQGFATAGLGAEFTVRLVKSDRPGELVHVPDTAMEAANAQDQADAEAEARQEEDKRKMPFQSSFDLGMGSSGGVRVKTWLKNVTLDGATIFQKRYKGKFLFLEASATVDLADGEHVIHPGNHVVRVKNGKATSDDPDIAIAGSDIALTCFPVQFCGINMSVDPRAPLLERMAHLPNSVFNLQVHGSPRTKGDGKAGAWGDVLAEHADFKPLVVYLPANTEPRAYRIMPSGDEFSLKGGIVTFQGTGAAPVAPNGSAGAEQRLDSGVFLERERTVWIPRYTYRAIIRSKVEQPLHVFLAHGFKKTVNGALEAGETFEQAVDFYQFGDPRPSEFSAGPPGLKPTGALSVACDLSAFPHRLLLADNTHHLSDEARLVAAALDRNLCRVGESLTARVQFRDLPEKPTLGAGEVKAYLRPASGGEAWTGVNTTGPDSNALWRLVMPAAASGVYTLRLALDAPGKASPASALALDFEIGLEQPSGSNSSVSVFTHYNREAFYENEAIELVAVVKNEVPLLGALDIVFVGDQSQTTNLVVRKAVGPLAAGAHTFHFAIQPERAMELRPETYRIVSSLEGCVSYGGGIRLVERRKASALRIATQANFCPPIFGNYRSEEGLEHLVRNMWEMGVNQVIDSPTKGLLQAAVPLQERAFTADAAGLPAADLSYTPNNLQQILDRLLANGMEAWFWRMSLIENLRWGPFPELDIDREDFQSIAKLKSTWPNVVGFDLGFWPNVEYVDMGGRNGLNEDQIRVREQELFPKLYKERYGLECPTLIELTEFAKTGIDTNGIYDRWLKHFQLRTELLPETYGLYQEAVNKVTTNLMHTVTEFDVCVQGPGQAVVPEIFYRNMPMSRWTSQHETGQRPLITSFGTALGAFDESRRISTLDSMIHFHFDRTRRDHFRLWQDMLMALACGADEIGYGDANISIPVRCDENITSWGFVTSGHILERISISSLNRALSMYAGVFENVRRERDVAILYSQTQRAFEHSYYSSEWGGIDPLAQALSEPFHRGTQFIRVESAFSALLAAHLPPDIITEGGILNGKLASYKGLFITGIELPLPAAVLTALQAYIQKGGLVFTDTLCKTEIPGAIKLGCDFDLVRVGWGDEVYRGIKRQTARIRPALEAALGNRFPGRPDCDSPDVYLSNSKWGGSAFLTVAGDRIVKDTSFNGHYSREPVLATVRLAGPRPVVYDLFELRKVDVETDTGASRFQADLTRVGAKLYAVLPEDIAAPDLQISSAVTAGESLAATVGVRSDKGTPVDILAPVELTLLDPAGATRQRIYRAVKGKEPLRETFKIAANDPAGEWRVIARELFGGRAVEASFAVAARTDAPLPAARELPDVVVYDAERVRQFLAAAKKVVVPYEPDRNPAGSPSRRGASLTPTNAVFATLQALGIPGTPLSVDAAEFVRRQNGPKIVFSGHAVIADVAGTSSLVASLTELGILPVRVTRDFPGPGRGVLMHVVSPFRYGFDAVIVSGGDQSGLEKALAALAKPAILADTLASAPPQDLPVSAAPMKAAAVLESVDAGDFPRGVDPEKNGMPVMRLVVSDDGRRILVATESFAKNVFMFDDAGALVWAGKGAKKWVRDARITGTNEALVADYAGTLYQLDSQGKARRRISDLGAIALSAKGERVIAAGRDLTCGLKSDGTLLWQEDYFSKRKGYPDLRAAQPRDDLVALSPDGRTGIVLDWSTQGFTPKGEPIPVRRMRGVNMESGAVTGTHMFKPRESTGHITVTFGRNSLIFTVANDQGSVMIFRAPGCQLTGKHVERGPVIATPSVPEGVALPSLRHAPTFWASRPASQFIDISPDGKRILAGFSNSRVVLLEENARILKALRFEGTVVSGVFFKNGFAVYADDRLRGYDDGGKELWDARLPILYRLTAMPDGASLLGGSVAGGVMRIGTDGKILWRKELQPFAMDHVDALFAELRSVDDILPFRHNPYDTELEQIGANVRLSTNLIAAAGWSGDNLAPVSEAVDRSAEMALGSGVARLCCADGLEPFATYFFVVEWKAAAPLDRLQAVATLEGNHKPVVTSREGTTSSSGWMELLLPVKTGPAPGKMTLELRASTEGRLAVRRPVLHRALFEGTNLTLVADSFGGNTRAARESAARTVSINLVVPDDASGSFNMSRQVEPIEMVDGHVEGKSWTAGTAKFMGSVEITLAKPRSVGTIAFYDDPSRTDAHVKQYIIEYYVAGNDAGAKKKDETDPNKADELDFKEEFGGEWRNVVVERAGRGPVHVVRLPSPLTSRMFKIGIIRNQQTWDTCISEIELYETRWTTAGGSSLRSYCAGSGGPEGRLVADKPFLGGGRFALTTPAFANGMLFLAKGDVLRAVRLEDRGVGWSYTIKDYKAIQSAPTVVDNLVFIGGDDCELRALDAETGELVWSYETEFKITGSPCVVGDRLIVGSADGFVYAFERKTGAPLWKYEAGQPVICSVAGDAENVYLGSFDRQVHAVDIRTGTNTWMFKTGGAIRSGVAVTEDAVYTGSDDGQVYAIDKRTGKQRWAFQTGGYVEAAPAVDDRAVYIGSLDGIFRALDRKTGTVLWTLDAQAPIRRAALVLGEQAYFYADDNVLRQADRRTGDERAQVQLQYPGLTDLTPVGSSLILGTRYGYYTINGAGRGK